MSRGYCQDCNAGRGLAVYPDSTYCHACKTYRPTKSLVTKEREELSEYNNLEFTCCVLPLHALEWLRQYYITDHTIDKFKVFWDSNTNRIIFPCKQDFYWMRSLDPKVRNKWLLRGQKGIYYISSSDTDHTEICIVEDVISAIRVSKHMDCVALGGTNFNDSRYSTLFLKYKGLVAFFDGDKAGQDAAKKFKKRFGLMRDVRIVQTKQDPKLYNLADLKEVLNVTR